MTPNQRRRVREDTSGGDEAGAKVENEGSVPDGAEGVTEGGGSESGDVLELWDHKIPEDDH